MSNDALGSVALGSVAAGAATMFAADRATASLGIEVLEATAGQATTRLRITEAMLNGQQVAHGGYIFALADTAFAGACNSRDGDAATVAADAQITFVTAARCDDVLHAEARLRTEFGRNGIYDVTVRRGDEVIAEFRGRSYTTKAAATGGAP